MPLLYTHLNAALIPLSLKGILVRGKSQAAVEELQEVWVFAEEQ